MIKTAMIFSAGAGTRLRPLTLLRPKPLFHVLNKTMLEWWFEALIHAGVNKVIINVHYLPVLMMNHIEMLKNRFKDHLEILTSLENGVLGTGGGLKQAAPLLGKGDFLVVNADIFSDFDLVKLSLKQLANPGRLATLGLLSRTEKQELANVSMGEDGRIIGFRNKDKISGELERRIYCGIMSLSADVFDLIPDGFSDIIDVFIKALDDGADIFGWCYDPAMWSDMGTASDYWILNERLACGRLIAHTTATVNGSLSGWNVIGAETIIEKGATVENCVLWPYSVVSAGAVVKNAVIAGVVRPGVVQEGGVFCGEACVD